MVNSNQFDLFEGKALRDEGMSVSAKNNSLALLQAKAIAKKIALSKEGRTCTIDDVQRVLIDLGINLGMAAGSVFKGSEWVFTGQYIATHRKSSHARQIKVWRLK